MARELVGFPALLQRVRSPLFVLLWAPMTVWGAPLEPPASRAFRSTSSSLG